MQSLCNADHSVNENTGSLKIIALVTMFCDHLGAAVFPGVTELRIIGRIALPLYAWCVVVGCEKTSCIWKYALRVFTLAVLSQPLYMMALNHSWNELNILFLLFLAILSIWAVRENRYFSAAWGPLLCYVILGYLKIDYGWRGLTFILLLYLARGSTGGITAVFLSYSLFWGSTSSQIKDIFGLPLSLLNWPGLGMLLSPLFRLQGMIWLALPFVLIPSRKRLRLPKWLSYSIYPLHLVLLILIRLCSGTSFAYLARFF